MEGKPTLPFVAHLFCTLLSHCFKICVSSGPTVSRISRSNNFCNIAFLAVTFKSYMNSWCSLISSTVPNLVRCPPTKLSRS